MKLLFVYRYYGAQLQNSVIDFQRESIKREGVEIDNFHIIKRGLSAYIAAIPRLRKEIKKGKYDLVHAHYNFSGFAAGMASGKIPVVCSLMGSDLFQQGKLLRTITKLFSRYAWKATLVKNSTMQQLIPNAICIPNGIDLENFREINRDDARAKVGFDGAFRNILFIAQDPYSPVKNLSLAQLAIFMLQDEKIKLHLLAGKSFEELPYYYNAADVVLLTSLTEGSPNVIKEAMATNTPIVSVDVGDVREVMGDTEGTYLCRHDAADVAEKIRMALAFGKRTRGREKVMHLDNRIIARKIMEIYKGCV